MNSRGLRARFFALGFPALAGFLVMYLYPFLRTIWYSMIDNTFRKTFVYFKNYADVVTNQYFRLAVNNTFVFSAVGVTLITALSLILALGLRRLPEKLAFLKYLLIAPMILPTAGVIFAWQFAFKTGAYAELTRGASASDFFIILPIYLLYIWKNTGLNIIILTAAISGVPREVYEAAALDGAKGLRLHTRITLPLISPSLVFVVVLSFVNALRSFRESYLYFRTDYPPDVAYTLQYYMNNHFGKLNYPTLTAASVLFTVIIAALLFAVYRWENKYNDRIY